jgi:RNA recognition motif-containing protein
VSTKLYVGNLPYSLKESDLSDTFKQYGNVISAKVVLDKETGRSKGFGFVEMENENDANNAIKALNGTEIKGRKLVVATAKAN